MLVEIKLDSDAITAYAQKAVLEGMSDDVRDQIMKQAVMSVLVPERNAYGRTPSKSPLQQAFESAVVQTARGIASEIVDREEFRARIKSEVEKSISGIMDESNPGGAFRAMVREGIMNWMEDND